MTGWAGHARTSPCELCETERCDVCGVWTHNPHGPHDPGCDRTGDCDCDNVTCAGCCWHCKEAS